MQTGKTKEKKTELPGGYVRPEFLDGKTYQFQYNGGSIFITINVDPESKQPVETFVERGKSGDEEKALAEGIGRLASIALQKGVPAKEIIRTLKGIQVTRNQTINPAKNGGKGFTIYSVPDALARALSYHAEIERFEEIVEGVEG